MMRKLEKFGSMVVAVGLVVLGTGVVALSQDPPVNSRRQTLCIRRRRSRSCRN